ncbi:MAG: hypothetical protein AAF441_17910 [Pseudomonadota bacterium]
MLKRSHIVALCLFASSGMAVAEPATGRWNTNYGPIDMTARSDGFTGTYAYKGLPAVLAGKLRGDGTYRVVWVQETSEVECLEVKQGSPYWGTARFIFQGNTFNALWNYCDRPLRNQKQFRWTGQLAGL